jgi:MoxR-like ATPase
MANESPVPGGFEKLISSFRADYDRIVQQVRAVIVGHQEVIHQTLSCMLGGGHALLEGVPGIGKTLLVRTLGEATDLAFSRIQFTPDLMPADITGTSIVVSDESGGKSFRFQQGPVFANLLLADEINRATPKTQSALLEAMQERTVSVARTTHALPSPFFVLATQNPLEMEGTYPLPEAQLDRFLFKIRVGSPAADDLVAIMDLTTGPSAPKAQKVADGPRIEAMRAVVRQVVAAAHVKRYIARLIVATHPTPPGAPEVTRKFVRYGASPRAAQAMLLGAKVLALRDGRANVAFDDVRQVAAPALRHRLILSFEGQAEGVDPDRIVAEILESVPRENAS